MNQDFISIQISGASTEISIAIPLSPLQNNNPFWLAYMSSFNYGTRTARQEQIGISIFHNHEGTDRKCYHYFKYRPLGSGFPVDTATPRYTTVTQSSHSYRLIRNTHRFRSDFLIASGSLRLLQVLKHQFFPFKKIHDCFT